MRNLLLLSASLPFVVFAGAAFANNPNVPQSSPYAIYGPPPPAPPHYAPSHYSSAAPFATAPVAWARASAPLCVSPKCQWSLAPLSDGNTGDYSRDI